MQLLRTDMQFILRIIRTDMQKIRTDMQIGFSNHDWFAVYTDKYTVYEWFRTNIQFYPWQVCSLMEFTRTDLQFNREYGQIYSFIRTDLQLSKLYCPLSFIQRFFIWTIRHLIAFNSYQIQQIRSTMQLNSSLHMYFDQIQNIFIVSDNRIINSWPDTLKNTRTTIQFVFGNPD